MYMYIIHVISHSCSPEKVSSQVQHLVSKWSGTDRPHGNILWDSIIDPEWVPTRNGRPLSSLSMLFLASYPSCRAISDEPGRIFVCMDLQLLIACYKTIYFWHSLILDVKQWCVILAKVNADSVLILEPCCLIQFWYPLKIVRIPIPILIPILE